MYTQTDRQTDRQTHRQAGRQRLAMIYKGMHTEGGVRGGGNVCAAKVAYFSPYRGTQILVGRTALLTKATS